MNTGRPGAQILPKKPEFFVVSCAILAFGAGFDFFTPLGGAALVTYVVYILSAAWWPLTSTSLVFALIATILTVFGYLQNHPGSQHLDPILLDRVVSTLALWVVAVIVRFQKETIVSLFKSEGRLHTLLDSTVDGIITIDEYGTVESYNPACEKIFGYSAAEVIGENIKMLMPAPYRAEHDGYLHNYHRTKEKKIIGTGREVRGRRKDGSTFPLGLSVSQVKVDGHQLFSGIVRDITKRKKADAEREGIIEKLARSNIELDAKEAELAAILNSTVDGIITIDDHGTVESYNPACERIFGYSPAEVIGQNVKMLMPAPYRAEHDGYLDNYHRTHEKKIIGIGREVRGRRKDGSTFPLDLSVSQVKVHGHQLFSGIVRDITKRKQAETEREHFIQKLARSNKELDDFAYVASHDLKAPLRVIDNASRWLEEDLGTDLNEEIRENLDLLRNRVLRMERLLDDLLEYSRIGRRTGSDPVQHMSGDKLIQEALLLTNIPEGFTVEVGEGFSGIELTLMPLKQIFANLINNAIKHHDQPNGKITLSVKEVQDKFSFSVKDDGPGIDPKFHAKVFKMFTTLQPRDRVEGSGMGLAMIQKHLEYRGEEITLESAAGQGSTFTFTWPKFEAPENTV